MCHFRRAKQGKKIPNQNQDICLDEDSISSTMTSSTLGYRQIICIPYSGIQVDPIYPVLQDTGRLYKSITLGYRSIIYSINPVLQDTGRLYIIVLQDTGIIYIQYSKIQVDYISSALGYRCVIYIQYSRIQEAYISSILGYRR